MRLLCLLIGTLGMLGACGGAPKRAEAPGEREHARLAQGARGAFERGELEYARDLYARQLVLAKRRDDPGRIGEGAFNLAACELALGERERARSLLDEARFAWTRSGDPVAAVHVVRARLELLDERPAACLDAAARALDPAAGASPRERVEALALRGLAHLPGVADTGLALSRSGAGPEDAHGPVDTEAARRALEEALRLSKAAAPPASVLRLRAQLQVAEGELAAAAATFEQEARTSRDDGRYGPLSEALELAGRARLMAGEASSAAELLLRSARSRYAHAVGRHVPARVALSDLARAAELCHLITESGALEARPALAERLAPLVADIAAEEAWATAQLEGVSPGDVPGSSRMGGSGTP